MKLSDSKSFDEILESPDLIKDFLAKTSTLHSDPVMSLRLNISRPTEAMAAYYFSLYFPIWNTEVLTRSIAHRAWCNSYQGKWKLVQEMIESSNQKPEELEHWFIDKGLGNEFFGNILPEAMYIELRMKYKTPQSHENKTRVKPINRREYKDKGFRRQSHEYHGDPPLKAEREDRRHLTFHPLVGKEKENRKLPEFEDMPKDTSEQKEVKEVNGINFEDNKVQFRSKTE